jgi:hypothetical protein
VSDADVCPAGKRGDGMSGNPKIGYAKSLMDYLFRWLELRFLKGERGILFEPTISANPQHSMREIS